MLSVCLWAALAYRPSAFGDVTQALFGAGRSSTMVKKIPIPKRHQDTFGGYEYNFTGQRGVMLHTDRYQVGGCTHSGLAAASRTLICVFIILYCHSLQSYTHFVMCLYNSVLSLPSKLHALIILYYHSLQSYTHIVMCIYIYCHSLQSTRTSLCVLIYILSLSSKLHAHK